MGTRSRTGISREMEESGRGEEMDSLFEGMVLFNPSQLAADQLQEGRKEEDGKEDRQDDRGPSIPNDAPSAASTPSSSHSFSHQSSQPLDENLFSDLTIVTPPENQSQSQFHTSPVSNDADSTPSISTLRAIPSISRQISRKKKRAGLRIGYGRDGPPLSLSDAADDHIHTTSRSHADALLSEEEKTTEHEDQIQHPPQEEEEQVKREQVEQPQQRVEEQVEREQIQKSEPQEVEQAEPEQVQQLRPQEEEQAEREEEEDVVDDNEKASPSSELNFERINERISEKLNRARGLVSSVSAARKDSIRRRRKAAENVNLSSIKLRELEAELEEACEAEDFERAERVSESLAAAEKEKQAFLTALRDAEADSDAIDSMMHEALQAQIAAEEQCALLLDDFAKVGPHCFCVELSVSFYDRFCIAQPCNIMDLWPLFT